MISDLHAIADAIDETGPSPALVALVDGFNNAIDELAGDVAISLTKFVDIDTDAIRGASDRLTWLEDNRSDLSEILTWIVEMTREADSAGMMSDPVDRSMMITAERLRRSL